jgi:hypothetical protein
MKSVLAIAVLVGAMGAVVAAQRGAGPAPAAAQSPQASAPIDVTGYWVSIVNEDWRWRMVTPPKGDYASVPLSPEGRKIADTWDPSKDGSCMAYGAAGLMRMPTRLHITWENDTTLKIETDNGQQTRRLVFNKATPPPATKSLQGFSVAEWERFTPPGRGGGGGRGEAAPRFGNLKVVTTQMSGGWLRRNGVPYSDDTIMTEYFDRFAAPDKAEWLVITTIVNDPKYLAQEFVTSTHFRREPNNAKWDPAPCKPM